MTNERKCISSSESVIYHKNTILIEKSFFLVKLACILKNNLTVSGFNVDSHTESPVIYYTPLISQGYEVSWHLTPCHPVSA